MSNAMISLFFAVGAATWIYSKMDNRTGGNTKSALTVAAACGVLLFLMFLMIISSIN